MDKDLIIDYMIWKASESGITISDINIKMIEYSIVMPNALCYVDYKSHDSITKGVYIKKELVDEYLQEIRDKRINLIIE